MHTYRNVLGKFLVGYYVRDFDDGSFPVDVWVTLSTHSQEEHAIRRVNALNGGIGTPTLWSDDE